MKTMFKTQLLTVAVMTLLVSGLTGTTAQANDAQLRAIGSLSASHIYTTYGYIGVLADAYVHDVYTAEKIQELTVEVNGVISANIRNLNKVKEAGLSPTDAQSVDRMIQIYGQLQIQAKHLSEFSKTRDRATAEAFEKTRKEVWPQIAQLLGIN